VSRVPALGRRGEGWVVLQLVLFAAIVACGFTNVYWPVGAESFLAVLGIVVAVAGAIVLVLALLALGSSFTPLPHPHPRAELRQGGPYRVVRHPIYGAVTLIVFGWSIAEAPLALVPTMLLAAVFDLKARREEDWLIERYPQYGAYRARTWRLVPWLY
jgi:protein-S-isoprenylcysteine O-methyltransferase Ste14